MWIAETPALLDVLFVFACGANVFVPVRYKDSCFFSRSRKSLSQPHPGQAPLAEASLLVDHAFWGVVLPGS